ncbi:hypothetical protein GCM10027047_18750 [Rhodococcus aerolatus]
MAEAGVRDAAPSDAAAIAAVQLAVWRGPWAEFLPPDALADLTDDGVAQRWRAAVTGDGDAHVLVATEGPEVVGFAAAAGDELATLLVAPRWGRRGHGGRLLGVVAERLAAGLAGTGTAWVAEHDTASQAFLPRHGWVADGAVRSSTLGARVLRERRHTGPVPLPWR